GRIGKQLLVLRPSTASEIDAPFAGSAQRRPDALIVMTDPFTTARRYQIVALANRHAVPAIYAERECALAGGLMTYSTNLIEAYHQKGVFSLFQHGTRWKAVSVPTRFDPSRKRGRLSGQPEQSRGRARNAQCTGSGGRAGHRVSRLICTQRRRNRRSVCEIGWAARTNARGGPPSGPSPS